MERLAAIFGQRSLASVGENTEKNAREDAEAETKWKPVLAVRREEMLTNENTRRISILEGFERKQHVCGFYSVE